MDGRVYGLLGEHLGHSYSVPLHQALGNADYRLIELAPEQLPAFLQREDIGGLNVTIPYKRTVMPFLDVLSPAAEAIGAVNTIVYQGGKRYGYNTDQEGFRYMLSLGRIDVAGKKVLVLGSGGASRTAQYCAKALGAAQVVVISRQGENTYDNLSRHSDGQIIINTTPLGMYPHNGESPVDLRQFPQCCGVVDVVYNPLRTALLLAAEELGIPHVGGLSMLVAQAKRAEELFFAAKIDDGRNRQVLSQLTAQCQNLVLIGMPGCGKTTVGQCLSQLTGREAVDTDERIVQAAGKSIPEIFAQEGEAAFRRLEQKVVRQVGKLSGKLILTGGGVVTRRENYAPLHQNGRIYELLRDVELLAREGRPLSAGEGSLTAMAQLRRPMYTAFRDVAIENHRPPQETAAEIWRDFCEHSGD